MIAGRLGAAALVAVLAMPAWAQDDAALRARQASAYVAAELQLRARLAQAPGDDEARFQLARVLAWQQRADEAVPLYSALLERAPDNADYLFGLAQAQLWSGDRAAARDTVARLESVAPAYPDLAALREQIAAASPSASASGEVRPAAPAYREAGLSLRHDWLTQGLDPWRAARFEVSGRTAEGRGWYVAGAQERRFGLVDSGVEAGVAVPLAPRWTLQVDGGGWPGSAFQPRWFGDVRAQYAFDRGTVLGASLRRTRYPEVTVDRLALGVEQYWGAWRFGYTFNRTDVAGNRVSGHDIAFDRYYRERDSIGLRLTSGSEDALQGTGIVASAVRAAAVQGRHGIAGDWSMQWAAGYVRQGAFYDRRWVQLGLRRAF